MEQITEQQLDGLVFDYSVKETHSNFETNRINDEIKFDSWKFGTVKATSGDITIVFDYQAQGGSNSYKEAHEFEVDIHPSSEFVLTGAELIDEDGDDINFEQYMGIDIFDGAAWIQLVEKELPKPDINTTWLEEGMELNQHIVIVNNDLDIKFTGEVMATATSSANNSSGSAHSGSVGRWTELQLYKTQSGKYICESIGRTQWQGERDIFNGAICTTVDEVIAFFGTGWLAKELYDSAKIDASVTVD